MRLDAGTGRHRAQDRGDEQGVGEPDRPVMQVDQAVGGLRPEEAHAVMGGQPGGVDEQVDGRARARGGQYQQLDRVPVEVAHPPADEPLDVRRGGELVRPGVHGGCPRQFQGEQRVAVGHVVQARDGGSRQEDLQMRGNDLAQGGRGEGLKVEDGHGVDASVEPQWHPRGRPRAHGEQQAEAFRGQPPEGERDAGGRLLVEPLDVVDGQHLGPLRYREGQHVVGRAGDCSGVGGRRTGGTDLECGPQGLCPHRMK